MEEMVTADLYRYEGLVGIKGFIRGLRFPGFRYMFLIRKINKYGKKSIRGIILRIIQRKYMFQYGFQIPPTTVIGKGLYIGHFGSIVINEKVKIGENCNIFQGVTIGQTNRGNKKGVPTISNLVWIGAGAVIVGNVKIGNNVLIAPNTYVNMDIPDNSLVIGNPAKIIPKEKATDNYIEYIYMDKESQLR